MIGAPIVAIDVNPGPRFSWLEMNQAAKRFYGFDMASKHIASPSLGNHKNISAFGIKTRKEIVKNCTLCFNSGEAIFWEWKYLRPDGEYRWSRNSLVPILDGDGEIQQLLLTSVDVTELIKTQKHLEEALTKTLSGFVKICANCKDIRHDNEWQDIETYASEQMDYHEFSHGMCAECAKELYGDDILEP